MECLKVSSSSSVDNLQLLYHIAQQIHLASYIHVKYEFIFSLLPLKVMLAKKDILPSSIVPRSAASHTLSVTNTSYQLYASNIIIANHLKLLNSITSNPAFVKFIKIFMSNPITLQMFCVMFFYMPLTKAAPLTKAVMGLWENLSNDILHSILVRMMAVVCSRKHARRNCLNKQTKVSTILSFNRAPPNKLDCL